MKKCKILGLAAALAANGAAPLAASAAPNDWRDYGGGRISGTIASVDGGAVHLQNGRTIFLRNGTVIAPTGQSLQVGERISVNGSSAGNGNINAQSIAIAGYGNRGYGDNDDRRYDDDSRRNDANRRRRNRDENGDRNWRDEGDRSSDHRDDRRDQ